MINPEDFYNVLAGSGVSYFTGVPDSLLKSICAYVSDNADEGTHLIAANEGASVALAMGHHLATGGLPLVYMQNSGLGNIVNPLLSLADKEVYGIPMLLMIGWRGEPSIKDEPQHVKQGRVTIDMLEAMEIPFAIIDGNQELALKAIEQAAQSAKENSCAYALVIKKGAFEAYKLIKEEKTNFPFNREDVICKVTAALSKEDMVISTTGMASRELFEYRADNKLGHNADFLTVGGMGHASQIALGISMSKPDRKILCIDGDGAALMHMGSFAINGQYAGSNYKHLLINNGAHDSVGGQPTIAFDIDFVKIAQASGYQYARSCCDESTMDVEIEAFLNSDTLAFLEVRVNKGNRKDLGRPTTTPKENKLAFMQNLQAQ